MSDTIPQATPVDLVQAAREMIRAKGAPSNAENLNRAMLAITRGQETTDFDSKLDAMANGDGRASRGASVSRGSTKRGANARGDVASADVAEINRNGRPAPSQGKPTTVTGGNENRPPETARAGDPDITVAGDAGATGGQGGITIDLEGNGVRTPTSKVATVPGTRQVSGSPATTTRPAQAGTLPASDVTGTPQEVPGIPREGESDEDRLARISGRADKTVSPLDLVGGGAGLARRGAATLFRGVTGGGGSSGARVEPTGPSIPGAPLGSSGLPPGSVNPPMPAQGALPGRGGLPESQYSTAYRMYPEQGPRIVQDPMLPAPPTYLPSPAAGPPGIPGPSTPALPPGGSLALPSSMGPPIPRGNLNGAPPQGTIPLRPGGSQSIPMPGRGQPRLQSDQASPGRMQDTRAQSQAVINELRRRQMGGQ